MKILLIINSTYIKDTEINECKNRSEIFIHMLRNALSKINGIEIIIDKCFPKIPMKNNKNNKNLNINKFPQVDHVIFINEKGFFDTDPHFINHLKKFAKYTVSSFCTNIKNDYGEDIIFNFTESMIHNSKIFKLIPAFDHDIYSLNIQKNIKYCVNDDENNKLNLLLDCDNNNSIRKYVINEIQNLIENNILNKTIVVTTNNKEFTTEKISYKNYINKLSSMHIYFVTDYCNDIYFLYELSMLNILIISPEKFIPINYIKLLNIMTFSEINDKICRFNWNEIFTRQVNHNIRKQLIQNNHNWDNVANDIYNKLKSKETINTIINNKSNNEDLNIKSDLITNKITYLNIIDKNTLNQANLIGKSSIKINYDSDSRDTYSNDTSKKGLLNKRIYLQSYFS